MYKRNCEINANRPLPEGMQRVVLGIEYSGASFNGFQRQTLTTNTIQAHLERALSDIAQEAITIGCAGRTDAGVHATGQIVHFDTLSLRPLKAWVLGANAKLPDSIRIIWSREAKPSFHSRFTALNRTYRYILRASNVRSAILGQQVSFCSFKLNKEAMKRASMCLVGRHDFSAFRSSICQASSPVREVQDIQWFEQGELLVFQITANAFLHHMVRNIMGSLLEIGRARQPEGWLQEVLDQRSRCLAGPTAEPWGLYLVGVGYPDEFELPDMTLGPVFLR